MLSTRGNLSLISSSSPLPWLVISGLESQQMPFKVSHNSGLLQVSISPSQFHLHSSCTYYSLSSILYLLNHFHLPGASYSSFSNNCPQSFSTSHTLSVVFLMCAGLLKNVLPFARVLLWCIWCICRVTETWWMVVYVTVQLNSRNIIAFVKTGFSVAVAVLALW